MTSNNLLPEFESPPLVEMVLGVDFEDLFAWRIPHYGMFGVSIRDRYPQSREMPPLVGPVELFSEDAKQQISINIPMMSAPDIRCWYIDREQKWLLQIQRNKFIQNWRKENPEDSKNKYPHYGEAVDRFKLEYGCFIDFVAKEKIGKIQIKQCEITYINHININTISDLNISDIFPSLMQASKREFLPLPETYIFNIGYRIPDNKGRLYISLQQGILPSGIEILQLTTTVRIIPSGSGMDNVVSALNVGHEWAVRGFTEFTSEKMHKMWERSR